MSNVVKTRFHRPLPGGGRDSNGNPKQGKVEVRGKIEVTNYSHGGESLTPADIGLLAIDWIDIKPDEPVGGNDGGQVREVHYSFSNQQFYILEDNVQIAATSDPVLSFNAFGDTVRDAELL
ncbi:MAG: hypothetical protein SVK08_00840 [Halobacteriota archaeon]|nr:hypothetical protein [Halobacteriota archaeon]